MYTVGSLADFISGKETSNKSLQVKEVKYEKPLKPIKKINKENSKAEKKNNIKNENQEKKIKKKSKHKGDKNENKSPKKSENKILNNAEKRIELKRKNNEAPSIIPPKKQKTEEDESENKDRTIFIANINLDTQKKHIKKIFSQYGQIETIRFRGVPVADLKTPKQVAFFEKKFHPKRKTMLAYIVFKNKEDAIKSKDANGIEFRDFHLRVDYLGEEANYDQKKSLFVGNVPLDAEEDDIRKLFEDCGKITGIRIIRDTKTNIGKGFCYVNFDTSDGVELALLLEEVKLGKRVLRLTRYSEKNKKITADGQKNRQKKTICILNAPKETDEAVIRKTFSEFGSIMSVKIYKKDENITKCYVKFKSEAAATKASSWKMPKIMGHRVQLNIHDKEENKKEEIQYLPSIYVQNLPLDITKKKLIKCFEGCGTIKSAFVYNKSIRESAVGFVNFESDEGVNNALKQKITLELKELIITRKVSKKEIPNKKKERKTEDNDENIEIKQVGSDEEEAVEELIENVNGVKKWEDDSDSSDSEDDASDNNK